MAGHRDIGTANGVLLGWGATTSKLTRTFSCLRMTGPSCDLNQGYNRPIEARLVYWAIARGSLCKMLPVLLMAQEPSI